MVASNHDAFFAHIGSDTVRYDVIHSRVHLFMYQMTFFRFLYDRICHRVRKMLFQAGCDTKQFFLLHAVERYHIGYNRLCLGQGSGLVKYDRLRFGNSLQKLAALDRNVMLACSCIADRTASGIASFSAQEKSTIRIDSAFVALRVSR